MYGHLNFLAVENLDKELTIGHMQGTVYMHVPQESNHLTIYLCREVPDASSYRMWAHRT